MRAHCPHCGGLLNGHTGNGGRQPNAGDMALCWRCNRLCVFAASPAGLLLRKPTQEEVVEAVKNGMVEDLAHAMAASDPGDPLEAGARFSELKRKRRSPRA